VPDNRLDYHTCQRRCKPKERKCADIRSKGLENPADICILKSQTELYPQKAEAHVEDTPKAHLWFFHKNDFVSVYN
jgi:hypothetical protein